MRACMHADTQIWRRDEGGQIKLSRVNEDLCLKKTGSRTLTLQTCDEVSNVSENRKFILSDEEHTLTTVGRSNKLMVGFELDRKFSRLRLYEDGSLNGSLKKWETKYGPNFDKVFLFQRVVFSVTDIYIFQSQM